MGLRREPGKVPGTFGGKGELSGRPVDVEHDLDLLPSRSPDAEMHATATLAFRADGEPPSGPSIVHRRATPGSFLREGSGFALWTAAHGVMPTSAVRNEAGDRAALSLTARSAGIPPNRGAPALLVPSRSR